MHFEVETSSWAMALFRPALVRYEEAKVQFDEVHTSEIEPENISVEEALMMAQAIRRRIRTNIKEKARSEASYWKPLYDESEEE